MIVGEEPGDQEDRSGKPVVGPAGRVLDTQLEEAGIDRRRAYVTNAVKHFKYVQRGKRRLHQSPNAGEIDVCRWWLDSERAIFRPQLILALGGRAARGVYGTPMTIPQSRGRPHPLSSGGRSRLHTHPSYPLLAKD